MMCIRNIKSFTKLLRQTISTIWNICIRNIKFHKILRQTEFIRNLELQHDQLPEIKQNYEVLHMK
jgi:hypothetical protein